jgi:hypothetical protein
MNIYERCILPKWKSLGMWDDDYGYSKCNNVYIIHTFDHTGERNDEIIDVINQINATNLIAVEYHKGNISLLFNSYIPDDLESQWRTKKDVWNLGEVYCLVLDN